MTEPQPAAPAATLPGPPPAPSPALPYAPSYASSHPGLPPATEPFPGGRGPSPMTPADETTWSTVAHLSWLAGSLVGLPVLGPLVLWLVLRERGPFVRHHTAEALNLQLSVLLYGLGVAAVGGILTLVTFGVFAPVWALAGGMLVVAAVVLTVVGAVAASRGQWYRFPLTLRFVR
ncbi:DUF4870 domain-containing protein [Aquipuribacter hungaricus]|uniref:DUF4870 domain-containing protein n=2 Tax=Aquipuribacter hungaricus TaxID=545624 RepID=A0ABV7WER3_9MICO